MKLWSPISALRVLVVLLIVSFVTMGFAHRIVTPAQQEALDVAKVFGFDLSAFCGDLEHAQAATDCKACRLQGASTPSAPTSAVVQILRSYALADWTPHRVVLRPLAVGRTHPSRAPPTV